MRIRLIALVFVICWSVSSWAQTQPAWLYAIDEWEIFRVDPRNGATVSIGRLPTGNGRFSDVAVTPDGTIYATTRESLFRLDPSTGLATMVGSLNLTGAEALAADRLGRLFGASEDGTFFEVNTSTGQARVIGSFGADIFPEGDLAFAPNGALFATSSENLLLRIDVATGQATVIGNTRERQLEGLAFDAEGRLYASSVGATLLSVDPSTVAATPIAVFSNALHMRGLAIPPLVNLRAATDGLTVQFAWDALASVLSYVIEAGSAPGLANLHYLDVGNVTTLTATAPAGTYFVRMRPRTATGVGFPSNEVQLTLGDPSCTAPPAPTGFSASILRPMAVFEWNATPGASSYHLEAGTALGLANLYSANVGSGTRFEFSLQVVPRGRYYVRLRAVSSCGIFSQPTDLEFDRRIL